jgi:RimJ/RimL family protein N-acetyltransferase
MKLRKLNEKDIPYMMEWMKDVDISRQFRTDFSHHTEDKICLFIKQAQDFSIHRHYAIVDNNDEYLGTISLKEIDLVNRKAEYAIVLRRRVIGTHIALDATKQILHIAFTELNLNKVYLNVLSNNTRANRFYLKFGFEFEGTFRQDIKIENEFYDLNWYSILKESYESMD